MQIPGIFDAINLYKTYEDWNFSKVKHNLHTMEQEFLKVSEYLGFGKCRKVFLQHIRIMEGLSEEAGIFEKSDVTCIVLFVKNEKDS